MQIADSVVDEATVGVVESWIALPPSGFMLSKFSIVTSMVIIGYESDKHKLLQIQ